VCACVCVCVCVCTRNHTSTRVSTTKFLVPLLFKTERPADAVEHFTEACTILEAQFAKTRYLATDSHPTIADLLILTELDQISSTGFNLFDYTPFPGVQRFMSDMSNLANYRSNFASVESMSHPVQA
jgi:glutathione S-transferase